jgi:Flp pilus assembly protein TadD
MFETLSAARTELAHGRFDVVLRLVGDQPGDVEALNLAGIAYGGLRRFEEAVAALDAALRLAPERFDIMSNLGSALVELDRFGEALALFRRAHALAPRNGRIVANIANLLDFAGALPDAIVAYETAHMLAPDDAEIGRNRAMALLRAGRFAEGWPLFEHRRRAVDPTEATVPRLDDLDGIAGKCILLFHEQGFGDTIQMLRYAPLLAARGAMVLVRVPPPLARLTAATPGVDRVVGESGDPGPLDYQAPLMSLPLIFGTDLAGIPAAMPYLRAGAAEAWDARLAALPRPWVGLAWAGSPTGGLDHRRSMRFADLAPILKVPAGFVSLQLGPAAAQWAPPVGAATLDASPWLGDFADTAALMSRLDLVITVDTAVAHLAAGLGRPVWVLDRFSSCWRWLTGRTDSPWYPTLRLLRQARSGHWAPVVAEAARSLAASVADLSRS